MQVYITAVEEGFLYGLLALGIYISLRILDIPDLTTEGSFGFGSAVAAIVASKGLSITSRNCYRPFANQAKSSSCFGRYYNNERPLLNKFDG